jgi:transcriptional regulator with XRE-family HTH domain
LTDGRQGRRLPRLTGKELKRIRLQLGLTQEGMARVVGASDGNAISRYERGDRRISRSMAILARHLAAGCKLTRPPKA